MNSSTPIYRYFMLPILLLSLLALLYYIFTILSKTLNENPKFAIVNKVFELIPKSLRTAAISMGILFLVLMVFNNNIINEEEELGQAVAMAAGMAVASFIFKFFKEDYIINGFKVIFFTFLCFYPIYVIHEVSVGYGCIYIGFIALWFIVFFIISRKK